MKRISDILSTLSIPRESVLLVHSAFRHLGRHGHNPREVVSAIIDYMSPGTVLFPTMSWRHVRLDGVFNRASTPSNTGVLSEIFRTQPGVYRSFHPTHSVSGLGKVAQTILSAHDCDLSPCAENSPFARMLSHDSWIVMMGIGMDCCTLVHHAEELIAPEHYLKAESEITTYRCIDYDGQESERRVQGHRFLARDFWQFQDMLAQGHQLNIAMHDGVVFRAFRAKDLFRLAVAALRANPRAIVGIPGERFRMM